MSDINPYVANRIILIAYLKLHFYKDRQKRVGVDNVVALFLTINRGVPQGTVLGPVLLTIMANDISPTSQIALMSKLLVFTLRHQNSN